ncbi:hypothetical protein [Holdemania massiliensis]|uniref:hypothetical protein n=1 Tax=Holdemania massiliensis TaxID=1468449 RepID=UPI001F058E90|nr:hypothetical protein [Holdemania massiliensis]MCH1940496.1 hypothetical protein [Holdemania massiliensis]
MKKYYGVITTFDDYGKVTANLIDVRECVKKSENEFKSTEKKDIYIDWFETLQRANQFIEQSLLA